MKLKTPRDRHAAAFAHVADRGKTRTDWVATDLFSVPIHGHGTVGRKHDDVLHMVSAQRGAHAHPLSAQCLGMGWHAETPVLMRAHAVGHGAQHGDPETQTVQHTGPLYLPHRAPIPTALPSPLRKGISGPTPPGADHFFARLPFPPLHPASAGRFTPPTARDAAPLDVPAEPAFPPTPVCTPLDEAPLDVGIGMTLLGMAILR